MDDLPEDIESVLEWRAALVDNRLSTLVYAIEPSSLADAVRYALAQKGKRVRSTVLTLSCEAVGGDVDRAIVPAMVVEILHGASLILDDIIDRSDTRRGTATVNARWGDDMALIACDALISLAIRESAYEGLGLTASMVRCVADSMLRLAEGEAMELEGQGFTVEDYYRIADKKTASLFSSSAASGAIAGGGDAGQAEALGQYGRHLGLAYQARDDILDFTADAEQLGKPALHDLRTGRPTLIMVIAGGKGLSRERMLSMGRDELLDALRPCIGEAGAIASAEAEKARQVLKSIPDSLARRRLEAICGYAVTRTR